MALTATLLEGIEAWPWIDQAFLSQNFDPRAHTGDYDFPRMRVD